MEWEERQIVEIAAQGQSAEALNAGPCALSEAVDQISDSRWRLATLSSGKTGKHDLRQFP